MHGLDDNRLELFLQLPDELATLALGQQLAPVLVPGIVVWLRGDLGAGKTALVRAILRARGENGRVKSPTYTLVETYVISRIYWYHFDFYRFESPEEFLDAGLGEYFRSDSICLVEWPDKAGDYLPRADLVIDLRFAGGGRRADIAAQSGKGNECLKMLPCCSRLGAR